MARLAGDHFAVLFPQTSADAAREIAARVHEIISRIPAAPPELSPGPLENWRPMVSIGVASYPADALSRTDLPGRAVDAVLVAKRRGPG